MRDFNQYFKREGEVKIRFGTGKRVVNSAPTTDTARRGDGCSGPDLPARFTNVSPLARPVAERRESISKSGCCRAEVWGEVERRGSSGSGFGRRSEIRES